MTATLRPEVGITADKLAEDVGPTGMIDTMPDRFWNELVDCGIETVEQFEEAYFGNYYSSAEFAEMLCDDCGYLSESNLPTWISGCIDWDLVWNSALRHDYFMVEGKYPGDLRFFSRHF